MRMRLITKTMCITSICVIAMLIIATPAFYELTEEYYTDQIEDIIKDIKRGKPAPNEQELKQELLQGVAIQFGIVIGVFALGVIISTIFVSNKLWRPFNATIREMERFRLEDQELPKLPKTSIKEFARLNSTLDKLMSKSLSSYRIQKEFTENASHELQTPLAIMRSKLDLLIQQPELTEGQAQIVSELYEAITRMSSLSRNLLLLSKIENSQYDKTAHIDLGETLSRLLVNLQPLLYGVKHEIEISDDLWINANPTLLEVMINNLVVNAIRHNAPNGTVIIALRDGILSVSNAAKHGALDKDRIFRRFAKQNGEDTYGNGLGLAIVKSVCDYQNWSLKYEFRDERHIFSVNFVVKE